MKKLKEIFSSREPSISRALFWESQLLNVSIAQLLHKNKTISLEEFKKIEETVRKFSKEIEKQMERDLLISELQNF